MAANAIGASFPRERISMFIPFLAASIVIAAFIKMGAMSVQIFMLTIALKTLLVLVIAAAVYMLWQQRKVKLVVK